MLLKNYSSTSDIDQAYDIIEAMAIFDLLEPYISFLLLAIIALISLIALILFIVVLVKVSATAKRIEYIEEDTAEIRKCLSYIVYRIDKDRQEKQSNNQETKSTP